MTEITDPPNVPDPTTGPDRVSAPADYDAKTTIFRVKQRAFAVSLPPIATWMRDLAVLIKDWATTASTASATASAAANYQGEYDAGVLYAIGESVTKPGSDSFFVKKTNAPAGTAPVDGTDWKEVPPVVASSGGTFTGRIGVLSVDEAVVALSGGTPSLDVLAGQVFTLTTSANTTVSVTGTPSGRAWVRTLDLTLGGAHTFTITGQDYGDAGAPTLASGDRLKIQLDGIGASFTTSVIWVKSA